MSLLVVQVLNLGFAEEREGCSFPLFVLFLTDNCFTGCSTTLFTSPSSSTMPPRGTSVGDPGRDCNNEAFQSSRVLCGY